MDTRRGGMNVTWQADVCAAAMHRSQRAPASEQAPNYISVDHRFPGPGGEQGWRGAAGCATRSKRSATIPLLARRSADHEPNELIPFSAMVNA